MKKARKACLKVVIVITPRHATAPGAQTLQSAVGWHVTTEHRSCDLQTALLLCCSVCSVALWIQSRVQDRTNLLSI
jgi:hypothetical protein